eukprot:scaffold6261_cov28-Tisochrysis_lutea.AAC.9
MQGAALPLTGHRCLGVHWQCQVASAAATPFRGSCERVTGGERREKWRAEKWGVADESERSAVARESGGSA